MPARSRRSPPDLQCAQGAHHDRGGDLLPGLPRGHWEKDIHHEAEVEHDGAKKLIAEIEAPRPEDDYFDAKVSVLSEMIKHHVKEEEGPGGMFSKSRESEMDLERLGEQLARARRARKRVWRNG
jgi:hypothetical protein